MFYTEEEDGAKKGCYKKETPVLSQRLEIPGLWGEFRWNLERPGGTERWVCFRGNRGIWGDINGREDVVGRT